MNLLCAECIVDQRSKGTTQGDDIKDAVTVISGTAVCSEHMMPLVRVSLRNRRWTIP